jgi:hypothetical protein
MSNDKVYQLALQERAVRAFVRTYNRAPTKAELSIAVTELEKQMPLVSNLGFFGYDSERPWFGEQISAEDENTNRLALMDDLKAIDKRLSESAKALEDVYRGFNGTVARLDKRLRAIESKVDSLLLANSSVDVFVNGFEESFDTADHVNWNETTASIEAGSVTLPRNGLSSIDLSTARINVSAVTEGTLLSYIASQPVSVLKELDGRSYDLIVYTKESNVRVSAVVEVKFDGPTAVKRIQLASLPIEGSKRAVATLFYSLDGSNFIPAEPVERLVRADMHWDVNLDNVVSVQIRVAKDAADTRVSGVNQWATLFHFDCVKVLTDGYRINEAWVFAGPYDIADANGESVYYTKATLGCCVVEPEGTKINWFLSADGASWTAVSPEKASLSIMNVGQSLPGDTAAFLDPVANAGSLQVQVLDLPTLDYESEAVVNTYIESAYVNAVPLRQLKVHRNLPTGLSVRGFASGIMYDKARGIIRCTIYVEEADGRWLDFGTTGLKVNGNFVTGRVWIPPGYSAFETEERNWVVIPEGVANVNELQDADPLYPYNHSGLISGYAYPPGFTGERLYPSAVDYFGAVLRYLPTEDFDMMSPGDPFWLDVYTIDIGKSGAAYIKVNVDRKDPNWQNERFAVDWLSQVGPSNQVWVKASLRTTDANVSPVIESFTVRVI